MRLWVYQGPAERASGWADVWDIADPVLYDEDGSVNEAYFVPEEVGAGFALNPRHYVIDREGRLVYVSAQVAPGDLVGAIEAALE